MSVHPVRPGPGRHAKKEPVFRRVTITPAMARKLLEGNTANRNVRERKVRAYAADMKAGKFNGLNGETIKIAVDGTILDGQHRLLAVVMSNIPLDTYIVTDLPHSAQETVDIGMARTFGDQLRLRGYKNYTELASLVRLVFYWKNGARTNTMRAELAPTPAQLFAVLTEHPNLPEFTIRTAQVRNMVVRPSVVGFAWWLFSSIDKNDAAFFIARLLDGQELTEGDAIYALRRAFTPDPHKRMTGANRAIDNTWWTIGMLIKAWNAYRANSEVRILRFRLGTDEFPEAR